MKKTIITRSLNPKLYTLFKSFWSEIIEKIEKQLITDLRPVENSSSTQTRFDYFNIEHKGELKKEKIDTLILNSKKELQSDHTRPYKFKK
jgi:hypothetical protein